jgi:long-chain acyl-CoA synthetase
MKALTHLFEESVAKYSNNVFMWEKKTTVFEPTTYAETQKQVYKFAAGLMSLGIQKGDRVALISEGRNDWVIAELGVLYAGAINVPLSVKLNEPADLKFRLAHSGAKMVIASRGQAKKLKPLYNEITALEKIILLDPEESYDIKEIYAGQLISLGEQFLHTDRIRFEERWKSVQGSDYANICYTSGTTADPKGIILTHCNYTANVEQSLSLMNIPASWVSLIILPWDHAFAHTACVYTLMTTGASLASVQTGKSSMDTLKNIPINIKEIRPQFLLSVPALAKNFKKNIESGIQEKGKVAELLFKTGLSVAYTYNGIGWNKGKGFRSVLKPLVRLFDKILFSKVREAFGGRLEFFIGGGALLDIEFQKFFYAIGIPMYQGYGLTEASPVISSSSAQKHKLGSSGFLVKPMELKICDEDGRALPVGEKGEIVIKGENVMAGYWNNPVATAESIKDGWLYTGDLGYMDSDGFLYVLGRFKSLLIGDDGEKFSPEGIEEAFVSESPFIDQCMLYNNQKPYTVALVYPNKEAIKRHFREHHHHVDLNTDAGKKAALKLIEKEIFQFRTGGKHGGLFPQRWLPAAIGILDEGFTEENQLLNSTMKLVRGKVVNRYESLIEYLYTPEAKNISNARNLDTIKKLF